jgi:hypothetical protein
LSGEIVTDRANWSGKGTEQKKCRTLLGLFEKIQREALQLTAALTIQNAEEGSMPRVFSKARDHRD